MEKVLVVVFGVAVVLCWDESALYEVGPYGAGLQDCIGALAYPVRSALAAFKFGDAVVLGAKCDQAADFGGCDAITTAFDVASDELTALAEANGVDGGGGGEDGLMRDVMADFFNLFSQIAEERLAAVGVAGVVTEGDDMDVGSRMDVVEEGGDSFKAVCVGGVT